MKLKNSFVHHQLESETVIVPTADADFHGLVQGNKTLAAIADCLKNDVTEEEIVDDLCSRFDGNRDDIKADVAEAIARLKQIGAIEE